MACREIRSWTFSKLVGAFLDLAIAYLMLCGSTVAYFASKFLGVFGLNLPCPCNGLFGNSNEALCVQRFLVEHPAECISFVHSSIKSQFPFDLICTADRNCQVKMNRCISFDDRPLELLEGEASCSSVSDARKPCQSSGRELVPSIEAAPKASRYDLKRKGVAHQRAKSGLRRRHKVSTDNDRMSSAASYEPRGLDIQGSCHSSINFNKEINVEAVEHEHSDFAGIKQDHKEAPEDNDCHDEGQPSVAFDLSVRKFGMGIENRSVLEEFGDSGEDELKFEGENGNVVEVLKQALKEEHASCTALYVELEKERNAAATAADEAMGMILRLQEEKASIAMQARQYHRMVEEKSAYDAEEMNLLKEILVRREREKHVLEREVENYKKIILEGEQLGKHLPEMKEKYGGRLSSSLDFDEDPSLMLQEISESIMKNDGDKRTRKVSESVEMAVESQILYSHIIDNGDKGATQPGFLEENSANKLTDDCEAIQEKGLVSNGKEPSPSDESQTQYTDEKMVKQEKGDDVGMDDLRPDADSPVIDVHVVGHESSPAELISDKSSIDTSSQNDKSPEDCVANGNDDLNDLSASRWGSQFESMRRHSDVPSRSPPMAILKGKMFHHNINRNSAVDFERLKIENEVELLREKLKIVQEGRDKLKFSVEHSEGEKVQLQLLEDIASQLRDIRLLRASERSVRQASAPIPSFKVDTRKRRSRSVSSGLNSSS